MRGGSEGGAAPRRARDAGIVRAEPDKEAVPAPSYPKASMTPWVVVTVATFCMA